VTISAGYYDSLILPPVQDCIIGVRLDAFSVRKIMLRWVLTSEKILWSVFEKPYGELTAVENSVVKDVVINSLIFNKPKNLHWVSKLLSSVKRQSKHFSFKIGY
jgi:hypothetical protein